MEIVFNNEKPSQETITETFEKFVLSSFSYKKSTIKNLIFDFGGVLYGIDHEITLREYIRKSKNPGKFQKVDIKSFMSALNYLNYEKGLITTKEFLQSLRDNFELDERDEEIERLWHLTLLGLFDNSLVIITELSKTKRLFLLSNTNEMHFNRFEPQCPELFSKFEKLYISFRLGMRKPDEDIFLHVLDDLNLEPEHTLLIDDTIANINTAKELGIYTFHINEHNKLSDLLHIVK
ncbi:MAG: HAD family phosphatase [FCB group bacterium]|jgi:putative hydrolase of the HAD superfamily